MGSPRPAARRSAIGQLSGYTQAHPPGMLSSGQALSWAWVPFRHSEHGREELPGLLQVTGPYVAARKTVSCINAEFARTTDQSCLNRFVQLCLIRGTLNLCCDGSSGSA